METSDIYVIAGLALFLAGWFLGRYSRDLYWCSKAWPSPHPTQACARGRLYWVADSANAEDCDRLLTELLKLKRDAVGNRIGAATLFCFALLLAPDVPRDLEWDVVIGDAVVIGEP